MKSLQPPDTHHLSAALGWLGLGNWREANEELDKITPAMRSHPDVLQFRLHVYIEAQKWDMSAEIAGAIIKLDPDRSDAWIHRSFALHELKRTQEAYDQLLSAVAMFPKLWTIPYNLSCYCSQLGRVDACKEWFKKAMGIDEQIVRRRAIDDLDLKPLGTAWAGPCGKRHSENLWALNDFPRSAWLLATMSALADWL